MPETHFTPLTGLIGGLLIGLASALLLLSQGRIAGISGIYGRLAGASAGDRSWRIAFLVGLPMGAWFSSRVASDPSGFGIETDPLLLVLAGLLVGVGTQLGNGCTSGHGVCGIGRGSKRSIVATITFILSAGITVFVVRHLLASAG